MSRVTFTELMEDAEKRGYAVGYFESWNMESIFAVADAAERQKSPVILGFSGSYLPHPDRAVEEHLADYAALGSEVCRRLSVPCALLFNESDNIEWLNAAIDLGFDLVMFTDETCTLDEQTRSVKELVGRAHSAGTAVEGEVLPLPGAGGEAVDENAGALLTDVDTAVRFVSDTGIDAFAVDIGQAHLHGRKLLELDIEHLKRIRRALDLPLVLHGASSVASASIEQAVANGIRKINVGSSLKRVYFEALRQACGAVGTGYSPYDVVGSLFKSDVNVQARLALQGKVEELMRLFGSAGKA